LRTITSFVNLHSSTKQRFYRQSTKILKVILGLLAPSDDIDFVWQINLEKCKQISWSNNNLDKNLHLVLTSLAEAYNNASHWTVRRQILSIMSKEVSFSVIRMFIPDLTAYRFNMARRRADFDEKGVVVDDTEKHQQSDMMIINVISISLRVRMRVRFFIHILACILTHPHSRMDLFLNKRYYLNMQEKFNKISRETYSNNSRKTKKRD
jgi:hypothetical protein